MHSGSKCTISYSVERLKSEINLIRVALQRRQVTGGQQFRREVSERLGNQILNKGSGRPKKVKKTDHLSEPLLSGIYRVFLEKKA